MMQQADRRAAPPSTYPTRSVGRVLLTLALPSVMLAQARVVDSTFISGNAKIHYIDRGSGDPVILLHGYTGSAERHWIASGVVPALEKDYRLIAFDMRGHGMSEKSRDPKAYGVEMSRDILRLMDHLSIKRAHIVGYSLGAAVVGHLVTTNPERFASATFVAGAPYISFTPADSATDEASARELEGPTPFRSMIVAMSPKGAMPDEAAILAAAQSIAARNDVLSLAALSRSRGTLLVSRQKLAANVVPALAIVGSADPMKVQVDSVRPVMRNLSTIVVPDATHGGPDGILRKPEFFTAFRALLASNRTPEYTGFPPDDPDSWRLAGTAKVLCSALFVSGRDQAEARRNVSPYFLGPKLDSITAFDVDRQRKTVRLTLANRITREAHFYGDQGCVIHQPGKDTVYFKPVKVTTKLGDASKMPWPMGDVLPTTPLPADVDMARVRAATDSAFANPAGLTAGFVVVHRGRIIAERYANGANKDMQLESWSMGKSITGALIAILIQQGAFKLDDPAPVPEWRKTPGDPRANIRISDIMRMSSGLRFSRGSQEDLPGYHDHDLGYTGAINTFEFVTTRPLQFEPNTFGRYRNTDPLTLNFLIKQEIQRRGDEYLTWPQRALFDKIGIRRQVLETDPYGGFLLSGYDYGTARNWARIGMLYLNDGVWNGERLFPPGWTKFVSTPAPAWRDSSYGGMVWVNARGTWNLPRDAFAFRGAGGQETYVVPSLDLVVVRMGHFPGARVGGQDLGRALKLLSEAIPPKTGSR